MRKMHLYVRLVAIAAALTSTLIGSASGQDSDGDTVHDALDVCPNTAIPESVPTQKLGVNRFALTDSDAVFDTTPPGGGSPIVSQFTLGDTRGCSCSQIIERLELGNGHMKFGCSIGAMEVFVAQFQSPEEPNPVHLLATGQTTPFLANKDDGNPDPVSVPDDGTLQLGAPLRYADNGDGTVTDLNTGLMWEKKCDPGSDAACSETDLHALAFRASATSDLPTWSWPVDGEVLTIWDWLDLVNGEGGTGFAGYSDWRIPNVRELESIKDYGRVEGIDPTFGPSSCTYWSSTSHAEDIGFAYFVEVPGGTLTESYDFGACVRAVRGGR